MDTKSKKNSPVWDFFTPVDNGFAKCDVRKAKLSYKTSVTNLKRHVTLRHPSIRIPVGKFATKSGSRSFPNETTTSSNLTNICTDPQPSTSLDQNNQGNREVIRNKRPSLVSATIKDFVPRKLTSAAKRKIDQDLMLLFTVDFQPFSIVEDYGFRRLIGSLNSSYVLPNRRHISDTMLPAAYEKVLHEVKLLMSSVVKCSLTTDCWTSVNNESFIGVTIHFIDADFNFKSALLTCVSYNERQTAVNLAHKIKSVTDEWGLSEKISLSVSDNAANIKSALKTYIGWKHFGCLAHSINLVTQDGLKPLAQLLEKVRKVVVHFKRSNLSNQKFLQYQQNAGKEPKKLVLDVSTRWNSTFYMLERIFELQEAIKATIALIDKNLPVLTAEEWTIIPQTIKVLKPFEAITKITCGENYLTASLVIVLVSGLKNVTNQLLKMNFDPYVEQMVSLLESGINSRFEDLESNDIFCMATFLDPRFKSIAFKGEFTADRTKNNIIEGIAAKINVSGNTLPSETFQTVIEDDVTNDEISVWSAYNKAVSKVTPVKTASYRARVEVERYLEESIIMKNEEPLKWWRDNKHNYPYLSQLAMENLCTIATSVPCERLFSKAGYLLNDRRTRLQAHKVEKILFLNQNSRLVNHSSLCN